MQRIAIYTCIIGAYDKLQQPAVVEEGFDFFCFVGQGEEHAGSDGVWQICEIPVDLGSPTLNARYAKMHPHELLPGYECSVWIDGNIVINDASIYEAARRADMAGLKFAGVSHPTRDCIYEEAMKCRDMRYISYPHLFYIWSFLALRGFPRHAGLYETNLMFRRHSDPDILRFDALWWNMILHYCKRDQLSQMFCLRKCGIALEYFLPKGQSTRNHPGFTYLLHEKRNGKA